MSKKKLADHPGCDHGFIDCPYCNGTCQTDTCAHCGRGDECYECLGDGLIDCPLCAAEYWSLLESAAAEAAKNEEKMLDTARSINVKHPSD